MIRLTGKIKLLILFLLSFVTILITFTLIEKPIERAIVFNPDGLWVCKSVVAIDGNTFGITAYKLRIPFCEVTNKGTIIIGTDIREETSNDYTKISIGIVRSTNKGWSFSDPQIIIPHTGKSKKDRAMDGTILVDRISGRIFVFAHRITSDLIWEKQHTSKGDLGLSCEYVYSDDDGITWSAPKNLCDVLDSDLKDVVSLFGGVGHGITMSDGTLVLPIQCKMAIKDNPQLYNIQSGVIYSKNRGKTWKASKSLVPCFSSECMVVEYEPGKLMANCRSNIGLRRVFITDNMGNTWTRHESDSELIEPRGCQGSLHKIGKYCFFLNPKNTKTRSNITLQISEDFSLWKPVLELNKNRCFGYSCICNWGGILYAVLETKGESILLYRIFNI